MTASFSFSLEIILAVGRSVPEPDNFDALVFRKGV